MKSLRLLFTLMALVLFSITAYAQDEDEEKWRNFEVGITGGLSLPSGDLSDWNDSLGAETGFNLGIYGGYYFTADFCTGVYFTYTQEGMPEDWSLNYKFYDMGAYAKYAFSNESNFEPYVKLSAGVVWPKFPTWVTEEQNRLREQSYDPALSLGGYVGLLWYTAEYGGLYLEAGYHSNFTDGTGTDWHGEKYELDANANYMEVKAGIMVFFGSE